MDAEGEVYFGCPYLAWMLGVKSIILKGLHVDEQKGARVNLVDARGGGTVPPAPSLHVTVHVMRHNHYLSIVCRYRFSATEQRFASSDSGIMQ